MKKTSQKIIQRINKNIKNKICKFCDFIQIDGLSCSSLIKPNSKHIKAVKKTCLNCFNNKIIINNSNKIN